MGQEPPYREHQSQRTAIGSDPMNVLEMLLAQRFSCRAFAADPVPRVVIDRLLRTAQRTPSWSNSQPWQVVIASGAETAKFREVMFAAAASGTPERPDFAWPRQYTGVHLQRRRECGFQLYNTLGIARGDRAAYARQMLENFKLFGAPHVAIITTAEELGVYGAVDCGLYVSTFLLAAEALGLGAIPQAALAAHSDVVRAHFNIGDDRRVVCGISFGYPDREHVINSYRTTRAPIDDVVTFVG